MNSPGFECAHRQASEAHCEPCGSHAQIKKHSRKQKAKIKLWPCGGWAQVHSHRSDIFWSRSRLRRGIALLEMTFMRHRTDGEHVRVGPLSGPNRSCVGRGSSGAPATNTKARRKPNLQSWVRTSTDRPNFGRCLVKLPELGTNCALFGHSSHRSDRVRPTSPPCRPNSAESRPNSSDFERIQPAVGGSPCLPSNCAGAARRPVARSCATHLDHAHRTKARGTQPLTRGML